MLSCLDKMYTQKYKKVHKSWAISFQNALFSNAMNIIKNNANGASEKGCRLVIKGDIVENSVGLTKIFDIYVAIFKCLSHYYKEDELKYYTEQTFEKIVQLNFINYGEFMNSPKDFVEKHFNSNPVVNLTDTPVVSENTDIVNKEIAVDDNIASSNTDTNMRANEPIVHKENEIIENPTPIKTEIIEEEDSTSDYSSSVMKEEPFKELEHDDDDDDDGDDDFDPDMM